MTKVCPIHSNPKFAAKEQPEEKGALRKAASTLAAPVKVAAGAAGIAVGAAKLAVDEGRELVGKGQDDEESDS